MIRLRAPHYHLFTGYNGIVSARDMVIPITKQVSQFVLLRLRLFNVLLWRLSYIRVASSVQSKGFESLKRPLHTSTNDDDDFADLGLPVKRGGCMLPKLMTEKPEPFLKISDTKKKLPGSYFKPGSCLNIKDISTKVGISSPVPSLDLENNNDGTSNFRTSSSVMIKNVPSIINLLELKEAISVFGKVSKASKRSVPNGLNCYDIEFKG
ncbi:hypothetical protein CRYUN_Cryun23aG0107300 [Craigia yunnanensis]